MELTFREKCLAQWYTSCILCQLEVEMATDTLRGKKCFITGAASGIGRATARAAAARGAELFLTDVNADGLDGTVAAVRRAGGSVAAHRALDITDLDAVR